MLSGLFSRVVMRSLALFEKLPVLKPFFDWAYVHVARNRYRLSSRFSGVLFKIAADRAAKRALKQSQQCRDGFCDIKSSKEQSDA